MYKKNGSADTLLDTISKLVTERINYNIVIRDYVNSKGTCPVILDCNSKPNYRWRFQLDIYVQKKQWDASNSRIMGSSKEVNDANLYLANVESKITEIFTRYRLMNEPLHFAVFKREYLHGIPRVMVIPYMNHRFAEMTGVNARTRQRYQCIINKLERFSPQLTFHEIDNKFPDRFKKWCEKQGNKKSTIAGNCLIIRQFCSMAKRDKIFFSLDLEQWNIKFHKGLREYLTPEEVGQIRKYYNNEFIDPEVRLTIGYFLISCFTGLRISEIKLLRRPRYNAKRIQIVAPKTGKKTTVHLTSSLLSLLESCPDLCERMIHENTMNKHLKIVARICKINKTISLHVGRHTFAMAYLRKGGDILDLKTMLKHSKLDTTMLYVHQLKEETTADLEIMGDLFS